MAKHSKGETEIGNERPDLHDVSVLYLDSEPISEGAGFRLSAAAEEMLELARAHGVEIAVGEPVLAELRSQFERELRLAADDAVSAYRRVARISSTDCVKFVVDILEESRRHGAAIEAFVRDFGVKVVPFTTLGIARLFDLAASRQRPFRETSRTVTDAGFKDAVIYLSVVDHLRANRKPAVFVSSDTDYAGAEKLLDADMSLPRATIAEMNEELRRRGYLQAVDEGARRRQLANEQLHQDPLQLERFHEFATRNFVLPHFIRIGGRAREITAIKVMRVEVRNLVPLINDVGPGEQVRLTVYALLQIDLVMEEPGKEYRIYTPAKRERPGLDFGFGEEPPPPVPLVDPEFRFEREKRINVAGAIEATAIRTARGYDNFEPMKLHFASGDITETRHFKKEGDAWLRELRSRGEIE